MVRKVLYGWINHCLPAGAYCEQNKWLIIFRRLQLDLMGGYDKIAKLSSIA
jgi:hypothetical protein